MSHPVSITDLLTAIGNDNIKFQYLATCMEGIKGAKGRNLITFGTDALTPSDVALNAGPSGLIIWVEGGLMRQSISDIKSGNSLTFGKVVEQRDGLLAALAEIDACFEAALIEGWNEAMAEEDISRIKDIYCRRIDSARSIAVAALSGGAV